jgi:hypothetical protein
MKLMLAKLDLMDARLNAMHQPPAKSNYSGGRRFSDRTRVPGLKPEDISRLRAEGRCFRCKKTGHMKNECPSAPPSRLN